MTAEIMKIGQVYRSKEGNQKYVVIALSFSKVFVSGVIDEVDPEWTKEYLLKTCELDRDYF